MKGQTIFFLVLFAYGSTPRFFFSSSTVLKFDKVGFLFLLVFPQHRAVVEATHPKNAPFAYLEAGQFKNSLVTTGLKKIPKGNKIKDLKLQTKKQVEKKKKQTHSAIDNCIPGRWPV